MPEVRTVWQALREEMEQHNDPTMAVDKIANAPARLLQEYVRQLAAPVARSMERARVRRIEQGVRSDLPPTMLVASPDGNPSAAPPADPTALGSSPVPPASAPHHAWHRLFGECFTIPGEGRVVRWLDATVEDHRARADWLHGQAGGLILTAELHAEAINEIESAGAKCLRDLYGEEAAA